MSEALVQRAFRRAWGLVLIAVVLTVPGLVMSGSAVAVVALFGTVMSACGLLVAVSAVLRFVSAYREFAEWRRSR